MKIRIKETGELKELVIRDDNNIEWTEDLLGNYNATTYNETTEEDEMSQDDFEWWEKYITNHEGDIQEIEKLAEELEITKSELLDKINEQLNCDLEDEHQVIQGILQEQGNS